ncbi:MAG TPA: hypothetical protein VF331_19060 [Polyangiales bacterium]
MRARSNLCARPGLLFAFALAFATGACGNDLPKATVITHMRVLGAQVSVLGDPTRSTPKPGETATLTFRVVYPSVETSDAELSSFLFSCTAPATYTGVPTCQELVDALQRPVRPGQDKVELEGGNCKGFEGKSAVTGTLGETCVTNTPKIKVKIEPDSKVGAKLVLGVICRNGWPFVDPSAANIFGCDPKPGKQSSEVETIGVYATIRVEHSAEFQNKNPDLGLGTFKISPLTGAELDGAAVWPPAKAADLPATDDDCIDAAKANLLTTADGEVDTIRIAYPTKARELHEGVLETLEVSSYATAGELSQRFTLFDPEAPVVHGQLQTDLTWKLSKAEKAAVGVNGKLVRFFFTVLDHRGGFDSTMRAVCVRR